MPSKSVMSSAGGACGVFAAGHLGELTQVITQGLVDEALAASRRVQARVRKLPSRVVVYFVLAMARGKSRAGKYLCNSNQVQVAAEENEESGVSRCRKDSGEHWPAATRADSAGGRAWNRAASPLETGNA